MDKEFISYEQALALKELGFNEPCMAIYYSKDKSFSWHHHKDHTNDESALDSGKFNISAPLYQQAFRWFRNKYHIYAEISILNISKEQGVDCELIIKPLSDKNGIAEYYKILGVFEYDVAEQISLNELIEIVKNKKTN